MSYSKLAEKALQNAHDFKEIAEKLLEEKRKLVEEKERAYEDGFQSGLEAGSRLIQSGLEAGSRLAAPMADVAPLRKVEFPSIPPLGLRPEATAIQDRIREIEQACGRYRMAYPAVALGREVPSAWTAELNRLKGRLEQLRLEKESEVGK